MQSCVEVVEYVEFWCGDAKICSSYWMRTLGFNHIAVKGMRTGDRMRSTHVVSQGETTILFTSSTNSEDKEFYEHLRIHGDAVRDIALRVVNVDDVYQKAVSNGAIPIKSPHSISDDKGTVRMARIGTPFGDVVHTLLDRSQYRGEFLPGFLEDKIYSKSASITHIDHIAMAYQKQEAHLAMSFYKMCLGFEQFLCSEEDTEQGMTILGKDNVEGGLKTIVAACKPQRLCFKLVLVEAIEGSEQNQVQEFLEFNGGHGVQHVALHSGDIFQTVSSLRGEGLEFLKVPPGYYQRLFEAPHSLMSEHRDQMEDLGLLLDVSGSPEEPRSLVQCFTLPIQDRPTFFLEIIQRKGSSGFGQRTIKALFEAIEKQRRLRDKTPH